MKNYFIYQYEDVSSLKVKIIVTVIFIHQRIIASQNKLAQEIDEFFQQHSISDKLVVIIPEYLDKNSLKFFIENKDVTFQRLPGRSEKYFNEHLLIYQFKNNGELKLILGKSVKKGKIFEKLLFRSGTTRIFKSNGGLVESSPDHHFVFPSNKHCSKFIRTGNVLLKSPEIFFIALQLLRSFEGKKVIYCDTSSINVLPFTVFELFRRFNLDFECPTVHSFESYEVFEHSKERFHPESLILISSSTSGNIVDRILKEQLAERHQIKVIYFLGSPDKFNNHSENIICNLTQDTEKFTMGEKEFETYKSSTDCLLCKNHSRPIYISSDVFLTIPPKIDVLLLSSNDEHVPKNLSSFVEKYRGITEDDVVLKSYFKEDDANQDYELFINMENLLSKIDNNKFPGFNKSFNQLVDKHVPANIVCLLYLPDKASKILAELIKSKIPKKLSVRLIELKEGFERDISEVKGSVVIVSSCITTGKKLLHISRLMRDKPYLNLIYFVGILRSRSDKYSRTLISNLSKGSEISDTRPFVHVEKIFCSNEQRNTSWHNEKIFLSELIAEIDENSQSELFQFIETRIEILRENKKNQGLVDNLFLPNWESEKLSLRKGFAFWKFDYTISEVFQSEVYFTISSIISNLENKDISTPPSLRQSNYIRNILSPGNFIRYNDGIIQAAILRAGQPSHFAYDLDRDLSLEIKTVIISMIEQYRTEHGEALLEFLLAIGLKKLRLKKEDWEEVLHIGSSCENKIISDFSGLIRERR